MKNVFLTLINIMSIASGVYSQNLLTEDFEFGPVDSIEDSNDWTRSGINSDFNITVVSPGLVYNNYVGSGLGNTCQITNDGNGDVVYKNLNSPVTSGSVYMAFMVQVDSLPITVTQGYIIAYNPNTGGTNLNTRLHIQRLSDTTFDMGVSKLDNAVYINSTFETGKTYLAILKYSINDGSANDSSSLYVFSQGEVPLDEPSNTQVAAIDGDDYTGQGSVYLLNNYAQTGLLGCNIKIDGIRVGTSWSNSVWSMPSDVSPQVEGRKFSNQNFPNPFQQSTTIKYEIPNRGLVRINIFNESGLHCTELLNTIQESGDYEIEWNARNFPPGLYTCNIQFNGTAINNKLIRLK